MNIRREIMRSHRNVSNLRRVRLAGCHPRQIFSLFVSMIETRDKQKKHARARSAQTHKEEDEEKRQKTNGAKREDRGRVFARGLTVSKNEGIEPLFSSSWKTRPGIEPRNADSTNRSVPLEVRGRDVERKRSARGGEVRRRLCGVK